MRILAHKVSRWSDHAYGLVTLGMVLGFAIAAVCFPPAFQNRGAAPVFATEKSLAVEPPGGTLDYVNLYAENAEDLHASHIGRLKNPPTTEKGNDALDTALNALTHHGAAWGLREGRVDFISLRNGAKDATLAQPNPHAVNGAPGFKRPLDTFEAAHLAELDAETPVIVDMADGRLRMLGLIPGGQECAKCHQTAGDSGGFLGAFSYHFTEIADD